MRRVSVAQGVNELRGSKLYRHVFVMNMQSCLDRLDCRKAPDKRSIQLKKSILCYIESLIIKVLGYICTPISCSYFYYIYH